MDVIWAPQAKRDFWNNIDYLETEWSEKSALHFIKKSKYNNCSFKKWQCFISKDQLQKCFQNGHYKTHFTLVSNRTQNNPITALLEQFSRFRKIQVIILNPKLARLLNPAML